MLESSLSESRANTELDRTIHQLRLFADWILSGRSKDIVLHKGTNDLRKTNLPIGPIAVFGSSNFPFTYSTIGGDAASALAAGCPVVVKAHPMHAATGEMVSKLVIDAAIETGMPDGVFSNLNIKSYELGAYLVQHDLIRGVGFTGSLIGGRALFDKVQMRRIPIPFFAEMGSVNPICIHSSALIDLNGIENWVSLIMRSISDGAGQFCTKPGLIFIVKGAGADEFKMRLAKELDKREVQSMLHPHIFENFSRRINDSADNTHVSQIAGRSNDLVSRVSSKLFVCTAQQYMLQEQLREETFGPSALIIECEDHQEMIRSLSVLEGQLTGTLIFQGDVTDEMKQLIESLSDIAGRVIVNGVPTGVEVCEAMHHGGPYPATTDSRFTAVGQHAIRRWLRPIVYQNVLEALLPTELR